MASVGTEVELGEVILILGLLYFLSDGIKKLFSGLKSGLGQIPDAAGATEGQLVGPAKFVGSGGPLTAQQALGISKVLGQEMNYNLSPDHFQIWFFNGDFYDNRDGLIRDVEGNVIAPAINSDGTVNDAAVNALVSANN